MKKKTTSNFIKLSLFIGCILAGSNSAKAQADMTVEGFDAQVNIDNISVVAGEGAKLNFKFSGDDRFTLMNPGGTNFLTLKTPDPLYPNGLDRVTWDEYGKQTIGVIPGSSSEYHTLSLAGPTSDGTNSNANDASTGTGHSSLKIFEKSGKTGRIQFENETSNSWHQIQSSTAGGKMHIAYYDEDQIPNAIDRDFTFDSKNTRFGIGADNANTSPLMTLDIVHKPFPTGSNIWDGNQGIRLSNSNGSNSAKNWVVYVKGNEFAGTEGDISFLSGHTTGGTSHLRATIDYEDGTYSNFSDARFKEDIKDLDDESTLKKLLMLKPSSYKIKNQKSNQKTFGLIAQDVQSIYPEIVTSMAGEIGEDYLGLTYDKFIPIIISSIQEQQSTIEELSKENTLLKNELLKFQGQLNSLRSELVTSDN